MTRDLSRVSTSLPRGSLLHSWKQWHAGGLYGIPLRCYYSRNLASPVISATHVVFGSTHITATA
jgi:hypothetical protein